MRKLFPILLLLTGCSTVPLNYSGKLIGHSSAEMSPPTCEEWLQKVQIDLIYCETIKSKLETQRSERLY